MFNVHEHVVSEEHLTQDGELVAVQVKGRDSREDLSRPAHDLQLLQLRTV